jgi:hypothetical protein
MSVPPNKPSYKWALLSDLRYGGTRQAGRLLAYFSFNLAERGELIIVPPTNGLMSKAGIGSTV